MLIYRLCRLSADWRTTLCLAEILATNPAGWKQVSWHERIAVGVWRLAVEEPTFCRACGLWLCAGTLVNRQCNFRQQVTVRPSSHSVAHVCMRPVLDPKSRGACLAPAYVAGIDCTPARARRPHASGPIVSATLLPVGAADLPRRLGAPRCGITPPGFSSAAPSECRRHRGRMEPSPTEVDVHAVVSWTMRR
jgi:hypothetical protein